MSDVSEIARLYRKVREKTSKDPHLVPEISAVLNQLAASAMAKDVSSNLGYCYRFVLPTSQVTKIIPRLGIEEQELKAAFQKDFGHPGEARMLNDPYYLVLLFLCFLAAKENRLQLFNDAFFLVLIKLWNGRRTRYLPFCNPEYMRYAVTMVSRRYQISKPEHSTPSLLLRNYFLNTLRNKYLDSVRGDPRNLKRLFTQAYLRIKQIFIQRLKYDKDKQMKVAQGGLLKLYMDAREKGGRISSVSQTGAEADFQQHVTGSRLNDLVKRSVRQLMYGGTNGHHPELIRFLNQKTRVSEKVIQKVLEEFHSPRYQRVLEDLYALLYNRLKVPEICGDEVMEVLKKKVISSKNNEWARSFVRSLEELILSMGVLRDVYGRYSQVQKMQIRNVFVFLLIHHARKALCGKELI